jgi:MFS family permease
MSAAQVGSAFGQSVMAGSLLGILLSLTVVYLISPKYGQRTSYIIYITSLLIAIIPILFQLTADNSNMALYCVFFSVALLTMGGAHAASIVQDLSPSRLRGRLFAGFVLFNSLISAAGPLAVGLISDGMTDSSMSLINSICIVSITCFLLSSFMLFKCRNFLFTSIKYLQPV